TADKVRGSIFDTLQTCIEGARFADLVAGSGAVGIEAYSRGAKEVVFCEKSFEVLSILKRNVSLIPSDKATIYAGDGIDSIARMRGKFDIIFCDPPYKDKCIDEICAAVDRYGVLSEDGVIIYEHSSRDICKPPAGYRIIKSKRYGAATLDYLIKGGRACVFAGSFDPFTAGHLQVVKAAAKEFDEVIVLIAVNDEKMQHASLEDRLEIARAATIGISGVICDICDNYVYKYCRKRGITDLVRGVRGSEDDSYERKMAAFNKAKGGLETTFINADGYEDISSSALREKLSGGKDIDAMCAPGTAELIKNKYGLSAGR
ncbi:MAG: 16S rRNA (guanine(966)-N(2))-methyltransferase RsmD, partial [Clostridia bacterium]|nr:16S rRNA (guanine(966)-N(2))-methyltransferase RsmD [Clostridia bacterium]